MYLYKQPNILSCHCKNICLLFEDLFRFVVHVTGILKGKISVHSGAMYEYVILHPCHGTHSSIMVNFCSYMYCIPVLGMNKVYIQKCTKEKFKLSMLLFKGEKEYLYHHNSSSLVYFKVNPPLTFYEKRKYFYEKYSCH
jgi:hypothetical protein